MSDRTWQVLESANIFDHPWYVVRRDVIAFPDGRVDDYLVSVRPEVAIVVPIDVDGQVILVEQYKHGAGVRTLEFPAGTFRNEDAETAAARELREETGFEAGHCVRLGQCFDDATKNSNSVHLFLATGYHRVGSATLDANERAADLKTVRLSIDAMKQALADGRISTLSSIAAGYRALDQLSCG